jgi:hypothetical protein
MYEVVEFQPCVTINSDAGTIDICIEDCPYVAVPLVDGVYHWVDMQLAIDDGRLVGVTIWQHAPEALR